MPREIGNQAEVLGLYAIQKLDSPLENREVFQLAPSWLCNIYQSSTSIALRIVR